MYLFSYFFKKIYGRLYVEDSVLFTTPIRISNKKWRRPIIIIGCFHFRSHKIGDLKKRNSDQKYSDGFERPTYSFCAKNNWLPYRYRISENRVIKLGNLQIPNTTGEHSSPKNLSIDLIYFFNLFLLANVWNWEKKRTVSDFPLGPWGPALGRQNFRGCKI